MTDRTAHKRLLESLGFVHIAGWVPKDKAPAIRKVIKEALPEVEEIKREANE